MRRHAGRKVGAEMVGHLTRPPGQRRSAPSAGTSAIIQPSGLLSTAATTGFNTFFFFTRSVGIMCGSGGFYTGLESFLGLEFNPIIGNHL